MECLTDYSDTLSDEALVSEASRLAREERRATAQLVAVLAEFDARRLYLPAGCASMFTYCTHVLRLSEHAAYNRSLVALWSAACPCGTAAHGERAGRLAGRVNNWPWTLT